jgi:peptide/nickel transport system permease protein
MKTKKKTTSVQQNEFKKRSPWVDVWRRLKRNKLAVVAMVVLIVIVLATIFAEQLTPYDYSKQNTKEMLQFPSWKHLFGTDNYGRDFSPES